MKQHTQSFNDFYCNNKQQYFGNKKNWKKKYGNGSKFNGFNIMKHSSIIMNNKYNSNKIKKYFDVDYDDDYDDNYKMNLSYYK